jgi:hypothetical protein
LYWLKYARREREMKGLQFSIELNEFVAAALLITVAVLGVGYWHTHRATAAVPAPVVPNVTCTSAAPNVTVKPRIVVPKPKVIVIYPGTTVDVTPSDEQMRELQKGKVWDNDNLPSAQDPPTFDPNRHPVNTASLQK